MAAKYDCILVLKDKAVLGSKKHEWVKAEFKTGANSTSPNANQLEESYAERRTQQGNNVTKRQND